MRVLAIVFATLSLIGAKAFAAETSGTSEIDTAIVRILTALELGEETKSLFSQAAARGEIDAETAKAMAPITERRFVELAVPFFRPLLSLEEAKELADFYNSDAMRAMLAAQKRAGGESAPVATTPEQAEVVKAFMRSKAAPAAARLQQALAGEEFANKLNAALEEELQRIAGGNRGE